MEKSQNLEEIMVFSILKTKVAMEVKICGYCVAVKNLKSMLNRTICMGGAKLDIETKNSMLNISPTRAFSTKIKHCGGEHDGNIEVKEKNVLHAKIQYKLMRE
jgi:hypothetical protein